MARVLTAAAVGLISVALVAASAAAATSTRVVPGWPKRVGAGTVHQGPAGGLVLVSLGSPTADGTPYVVSAFRRDGRRLWADSRVPACGNCDDGPQPEALQPDGTYGPIGVEGDDFWAVDSRGREVIGCSGAVAADGTCYFVRPDYTTSIPAIVARSTAGDILWSVGDPAYRWIPESDVPPMVVRDRAGLIYTAFGIGSDAATGVRRPGRLVQVDPSTGTLVWGREGPDEVLTALASGVLASREGGIVAFGPGGAERWSRPLARQRATPAATVYDRARNRVYVGRSGGTPGVTALVATTGVQVWRTRPKDRARLLSVGRSGRVYLGIDAPGRRAVRAVRIADGRLVWQRRTGQPVQGARELRNGTVAVSAGARFARTRADRLTVLDPRR